MLIYIESLTDKTFTLDVESGDTIQLVKTKIKKIKGYPKWFQRLLFKRRDMDNDRTLADYNVQEGNTLHLVLRLRGGAS